MTISKLVIDEPRNRCITKPSGTIKGWLALHNYEIPEDIQFRVGPIILPHTLSKREDVEGAMPEHGVAGFQIRYDLSGYLLYIEDQSLSIKLTLPDFSPLTLRFKIQEGVLASCIAAASGE
jgi:hypothetical protein